MEEKGKGEAQRHRHAVPQRRRGGRHDARSMEAAGGWVAWQGTVREGGGVRLVGCYGALAWVWPVVNRTFFLFIQNISIDSNLKWPKECLLVLKQFQIKYGFEKSSNFPYRNFL
jgi:hypothetical protein